MIRFDDLTILVLAVGNGNLSTVARVLNIMSTATSTAIKRLKTELGVRLPARSIRSLALTQKGERYL